MLELKKILDTDDVKIFKNLIRKEIYDTDEVLMYLYAAVAYFNSEDVFQYMIMNNNYFEVSPDLHHLFSEPGIYY